MRIALPVQPATTTNLLAFPLPSSSTLLSSLGQTIAPPSNVGYQRLHRIILTYMYLASRSNNFDRAITMLRLNAEEDLSQLSEVMDEIMRRPKCKR